MRVAVCQMNAGRGDVEANVATASRLLEEAAARGADLAALPELWPYYGGGGGGGGGGARRARRAGAGCAGGGPAAAPPPPPPAAPVRTWSP